MLQFLRIRNLALLDEVSLDFESGFTAVTGETGAGKSVLLGALGLLAGVRADRSMIRQGADVCEVEGEFYFRDSRAIDSVLESAGLPLCEDGALLIKRILPREKAPRISVNGSLATLANLQAIGEHWIDFHGPSEPRRLLRPECQTEFLDLFGKLSPQVDAYRADYDAWRGILRRMEELASETQLTEDQIDFLRTQIAKIDQLPPDEESLSELERDCGRLARSQDIGELADGLGSALGGDDGMQQQLAAAVRMAQQLEQIDPSTSELAARLVSLSVEMADLASEYSALTADLNFDEDVAVEMQAKLGLWLELKRKYGGDFASVRKARDSMQEQIDGQGDIEGTLAKLMVEASAKEKSLRAQALSLREAREKAGRSLVAKAAKVISRLGFKRADLKVQLIEEDGLKHYGDARPEFLFAPNVGEPLLPLARIASSGELARVMLAIKSILAEVDDIPVLVFDEVDANVGGEIGRAVGESMAEIARSHQVFCVTHLPQVASLADRHFVVEKDQSGSRAVVSIRAIHDDRETRVGELARMLGDRTAKSAQAHARELLKD